MAVIISEEDHLAHIGIIRRSGRYPWGSGKNPYQRSKDFVGMVEKLRKEDGMSEVEIARAFGITTTQLRAAKSIANNRIKQANISEAQRLKDKGYSNVAIGNRMGLNESSVRALLAPGAKDKADVLTTTVNMLKDQVAEKGLIDVGAHVERHVGVSATTMKTALAVLQEEGYGVHKLKEEQLGTGHKTEFKVLAPPGVTQKEAWTNRGDIRQISEHSDDGGRTFLGIEPPVSIDSKRVQVIYAEDGGTAADGVIYVRPGVDDVSLGNSRYAQVRVAVDGTHYLKGMAMYKSDLPDGVDLAFNTNKSKKDVVNDYDAMKVMKDDPDNPFGAVITRQKGVMNILNEEGAWQDWTKTISTQVLSKQSPVLAKQQLDLTYERKVQDLEEIMALTNPAVKRKLLEAYADGADSSAVHLKAAAMPRQATHVILPVNSLKPTEVYAPNYENGERVILIRYPHGGIFEIPELVVNNNHAPAKKLIGERATDAIGINNKVAERLSGADFDGDTVLVIPNNQGKFKTAPALEGLKNFDPRSAYPAYEGMKPVSNRVMQQQMGDVSNLITDMTIRGASGSELARAVRHSMVAIDSQKHNLNYKQSLADNGIGALKEKYQGGKNAGASTLISRATSEKRVNQRKPRPAAEGGPIDPKTGKRVYVETGESYVNSKGVTVIRKRKSTKLAETDDAHTLSSGTPIEKIYADHSNRLKSLANRARREQVAVKSTPYSPSAKAAYKDEVASLDAKLNTALKNAPRERQAQIVANAVVRNKREANPGMSPEEVKKVRYQALTEARNRTGANKERVNITPREWEAIQAGAVSNSKLNQILRNTDLDRVKELATPRVAPKMTPIKQLRARSMANAGYTQAEIAAQLGVSATTISTTLNEGG